ncbi:hypothetical protein IQ241_23545 [Romeria aff. gracilis LEGE 07310]|uniref:Uncharacterized protein n=1 Tax=Vasconcelosia minhoensis LEGE 07310 TaxID=915328 RepID=A0A8J7DPS7_9CYAN|nr:hypothetical protein [Romeria gracilis]MBE9080225.1 hypothetical protein [Romeria aff. gracilis LEGE 07310]
MRVKWGRSVIEILGQMLFWQELDYEDIIPVLEAATNYSNAEVRKFAIGIVNEETI